MSALRDKDPQGLELEATLTFDFGTQVAWAVTSSSRRCARGGSKETLIWSGTYSQPAQRDRMVGTTNVDCLVAADRLVGLVVKASASRAADPGSNALLLWIFFPGRVLPMTYKLVLQGLPRGSGAWSYRVSAGTGWPGVSVL